MYYLPKSNTPSSFIFVVHFIIYHDINVINMAMNIDVIYPKDMRNMEILTPPINLMMKICQLLE